jgi:hypothetical protein
MLRQTVAMVKSAARPLVSCWSFSCQTGKAESSVSGQGKHFV